MNQDYCPLPLSITLIRQQAVLTRWMNTSFQLPHRRYFPFQYATAAAKNHTPNL